MRLPPGRLHQFLTGNPARPLQQVQDLGGLAPFAGTLGLCRGLGRFLRGAGLLLPALAFLGATGARCGAPGAFLLALGFAPVAFASGVPVSSAVFAIM